MTTSEASQHAPNTDEMKALIAQDLAASNDLAGRITRLRQDISEGKTLPPKKIDLMERSNKDMTKDTLLRIEKIEEAREISATDREMLQALNARLAVCDLQTMRLAELRDLETAARGEKKREFLEAETNETETPLSPKHAGEVAPEEKYASTPDTHAIDQCSSTGEHGADSYRGDTTEEEEDPEIDQSSWPLLYRILSVDPSTKSEDISAAVGKARKTLAPKHNPKNLPNDPAAPARWEAITKAHDVLAHPEKRSWASVERVNQQPIDRLVYNIGDETAHMTIRCCIWHILNTFGAVGGRDAKSYFGDSVVLIVLTYQNPPAPPTASVTTQHLYIHAYRLHCMDEYGCEDNPFPA
ncbi:hypothetical protein Q7P37_007270 [Cladosporium fusiforme]